MPKRKHKGIHQYGGVKGNATRKLINAKLRKMRIRSAKGASRRYVRQCRQLNCSPARHRLSFPVMENNRRYNGRLRPTSRRPIFLIGISIRNPPTPLQVPKGKSMFQQLYEYGFGGSSESSVDLGAGNPAEWTPAFTPETSAVSITGRRYHARYPEFDGVFPQGLPQAGNTFGGSTFDPVTAPPPSQTFFDQAKTYLAAGYESFTEMARDAWDRLAGPNNVPYQGDDGIFYKDSSKTELATKSQMDNLKWRPVDRGEGFKIRKN